VQKINLAREAEKPTPMNHDIFTEEATLEQAGTFKAAELNQIIDDYQESIKHSPRQDIPSYQIKERRRSQNKKTTIETENLN
jgi:hypothetical protein